MEVDMIINYGLSQQLKAYYKFMHYNETIEPRRSRNPLGKLSSNNLSGIFSKKNSSPFNKSFNILHQSSSKVHKSSSSIDDLLSSSFLKKKQNFESIDRSSKAKEKNISQKEMKIQQLRFEMNFRDENVNMNDSISTKKMKQSKESKGSHLKYSRNGERSVTEMSQCNFSIEETMFSPKILNRSKSMFRKLDISTLLYEDAIRRQEKQQNMLQSQRKQIDILMSPKINSNTNALVLKRINGQFRQLVTQEQMNPLVALSVLQEIFNVNLNPHKQSANYQSVQKLLNLLMGSKHFQEIKREKLWQFIELLITGTVEDSLYSQTQEKQIIENYQSFYKERMTKDKKEVTPEKYTFRPATNQSSNKMAQSFRQKSYRKIDQFVQNQKLNLNLTSEGYSLEELYLIEHHKRLAENEKKKIEKENQELAKCTFQPDLSPSASTLKNIKQKPKIALKSNRAQYLKTEYTQCSQYQSETQKMNTSKIIPIRSRQERQKMRKARQLRQSPIGQSIRDVEKAVLRMSVGRQKRQYSNKVLQRGYPQGQNWTEYQKQMHRKSIENNKKLKGLQK